jgi:RNA polymerase sigma factor (sigma-70 family)
MAAESRLSSNWLLDSRRAFATTSWSLVAAASESESIASRAALEELCKDYWPPLYSYLRASGISSHEASDLVQGFFCELIEGDRIKIADSERGRFRNFLLASIKNYSSNHRRKQNTIKRGGKANILNIDSELAEAQYSKASIEKKSADELFDRQWALTVIDNALENLKNEYRRDGKESLFSSLKIFLVGENVNTSYEQIAKELDMTVVACKVTVHRMRKRCQKWIRYEIAQTVSNESEIDEEIELLFRVLG